MPILHKEREGSGKSFILYRKEIFRLIAAPKPASEALKIELPCLMGFRSEEVTTWKAEYRHSDSNDCEVFDAKKHRLVTVPMNLRCDRHAEEVLNGRTEGYVIPNESTAWKGREEPLSTTAIWYAWRRWAKRLHLFPRPEDYSPIVGRRFFVKEFLAACKDDPYEGLISCSKIVRHSNPRITLEYAEQITFYEDVKRNFDRFQFRVMEELAKNMIEVEQVG